MEGRDDEQKTVKLQWRTRYESQYSKQSQFTERLADLVGKLVSSANIDVAVIECRTKTPSSFREKLDRKPGRYSDPLQEMTDLSGVRVITYYAEDVDLVSDLIRGEFNVDTSQSESTPEAASIDRFGYVSSHFIVKLKSPRSELDEWRPFNYMVAEVQVRTVLQHAWSSVSHKVAYKREAEVPSRLRRRLSRLSALFELADEQFSQLRAETTVLRDEYAGKVIIGDLDLEIDNLSLEAYFSSPLGRSQIERIAEESGWAVLRPAHDETLYIQDMGDLLRIIRDLDIRDVAELSNIISSENFGIAIAKLGVEQQSRALPCRATVEDIVARALLVMRGLGSNAFEEVYSRKVVSAIATVHERYRQSTA